MKHSVFIVDDHDMVRQGLIAIVSGTDRLEVAGEAASGEEALEKIAASVPNLAMVDISMTGMNGLVLTQKLTKLYPELPVLIVSMHEKETYREKARAAGARGYLAKTEAAETLVDKICSILSGAGAR